MGRQEVKVLPAIFNSTSRTSYQPSGKFLISQTSHATPLFKLPDNR